MRSREQTSSFSLILPDINIKPTFQGSTDNLNLDVEIQNEPVIEHPLELPSLTSHDINIANPTFLQESPTISKRNKNVSIISQSGRTSPTEPELMTIMDLKKKEKKMLETLGFQKDAIKKRNKEK